ncbi:MAG TPA: hypothetical protein VNO70_00600 [Blastocatellia bacterium]|nr:hypothetical protein [Blastocatellia bacterium]
MRSKLLTLAWLIIAAPLLVVAGNGPEQVRKSELSKHPFTVGQLKLTITYFHAGLPLLSHGVIEVKVENPSSSAEVFDPHLLSLVSKNNSQVHVAGRIQSFVHSNDRLGPAQARSVAPGAHMKEYFEFTGRVKLPAKLFYDGKELAVITD